MRRVEALRLYQKTKTQIQNHKYENTKTTKQKETKRPSRGSKWISILAHHSCHTIGFCFVRGTALPEPTNTKYKELVSQKQHENSGTNLYGKAREPEGERFMKLQKGWGSTKLRRIQSSWRAEIRSEMGFRVKVG